MTNRLITMRGFSPEAGRLDLTVEAGLTIAQMIDTALPGLPAVDRGQVRVMLVTDTGAEIVTPAYWAMIRPRPGVRVVIRIIPAGDALRQVMSIVIAVAAVALAATFAPVLAGTLGISTALAGGLITAGVTLVGGLIMNALVPPPSRPDNRAENRYTINGWRNELRPDGAVPVVLGRIRYAPPFAALTYTEIVGDWQYIRAFFTFGYGPLNLSDLRIGETSIDEFDDVEIEIRDGLVGDDPVTIYPAQIAEEAVGAELTRLRPRDALGEVDEDAAGVETPVVRTTGSDAEGASVIFGWPGGLVRLDDDGDRKNQTVTLRIRQRQAQAEEWQEVETLEITARKLEPFYRQHSWTFPSRGRWQVEVTMMTDENLDTQVQARTVWAALQTLRPEYPIAFAHPLTLVAVRIRATHQLNGSLDRFTALAERICPDWDAETGAWITRATRNPASLYRWVLQGPANPRPATDAQIDLGQLQDWHDFCRQKSLNYDRVQDAPDTSLRDVLTEIAAAGRATPRHDGLRWGVTIDRPQDLVIDHISPRNSWGFTTSRSYREPPHALRVAFNDEGNDYKEAQRTVRWIGYEGPIDLTEVLDIPGKTNATEIAREAIRRMYEAEHRPDTYEVKQDGLVRVASRGDLVRVSYDLLDHVQRAARVVRTSGFSIELDDEVRIEAGHRYSLRWRVFDDDEDTVGRSVDAEVFGAEGWSRTLTFDHAPMPEAGALVLFGSLKAESFEAIVREVEQGEGSTQILRLIDAAPQIDELADAAEIPAWSSRVGEVIDENLLQPGAPRFTSVASGVSGTGRTGHVTFLLEPATGGVAAVRYEVDHRAADGAWSTTAIPVANGGGDIEGYANGVLVEIRACSVAVGGQKGPYTSTITFVVGAGDIELPSAIDTDAITVSTLLGGALLQVAIADPVTTRLQLYRSTSAELNRATDAVGSPVSVSANQSWSISVGDTTRVNLIQNGGFTSAADWTLDEGWAISGGAARHAPGAAGDASQALELKSGRWYRIGYTVGRAAGSIVPLLEGGSDRLGTPQTESGAWSDRIQAVTGNSRLSFRSTADFDGSVDDVIVYLQTNACLAQGTHYLWLEPQNDDGAPGPLSGPFVITVI